MPRLSIRLALIAFVVLPVAAILTGATLFVLRSLETYGVQQMQEDVEVVAQAIQRPLSRSLERGHEGTVHDALASAFSIERVYSAYVYDAGGQLIASAGAIDRGISTHEMSALAARGDEIGEYRQVGGREVYSFFVPLTDSGGRISGLLQVTRRTSDFHKRLQMLRSRALLGLFITTLLLTGLVIGGHHQAIGKHAERLVASMRHIQSGNHSHRTAVTGPVEIAKISEMFNSMLDGIERANQEITERKHSQHGLEKKLQQQAKLAAIGQLAAGVAHELGTPLSVIDGVAQRELRTNGHDAVRRETLEKVRKEVRRMERIVRQLLAFGRRHEPQYRLTPVRQLAASVQESVSKELAHMDVELSIEVDPPDLSVPVDPLRIEQAVINVVRNAIQASRSGRVDLKVVQREDYISFEIEDDGLGITDEVRGRLFEPFFTTKEVGEGTGLGLALVHGIIEEHRGFIEVGTSELGGARFALMVPRTVDVAPDRTLAIG